MIDVGSDTIARSILGVVEGYTTSLVIDLGFVIEGTETEELPECVLGCVRLCRLDLSKTTAYSEM